MVMRRLSNCYNFRAKCYIKFHRILCNVFIYNVLEEKQKREKCYNFDCQGLQASDGRQRRIRRKLGRHSIGGRPTIPWVSRQRIAFFPGKTDTARPIPVQLLDTAEPVRRDRSQLTTICRRTNSAMQPRPIGQRLQEWLLRSAEAEVALLLVNERERGLQLFPDEAAGYEERDDEEGGDDHTQRR